MRAALVVVVSQNHPLVLSATHAPGEVSEARWMELDWGR